VNKCDGNSNRKLKGKPNTHQNFNLTSQVVLMVTPLVELLMEVALVRRMTKNGIAYLQNTKEMNPRSKSRPRLPPLKMLSMTLKMMIWTMTTWLA